MKSQGYILSIESSGESGGAAVLALDGRVLSEVPTEGDRTHGALLVTCVDQAVREAGIEREHLGGVLVNSGPGSYTGLRVGVAAAEAIGLALGIPVLGVPCFEVMCEEWLRMVGEEMLVVDKSVHPPLVGEGVLVVDKSFHPPLVGEEMLVVDKSVHPPLVGEGTHPPRLQAGSPHHLLIPALDARQNACATAAFAWSCESGDVAQSNLKRLCDDAIVEPSQILTILNESMADQSPACPMHLFGQAAAVYQTTLPAMLHMHIERFDIRPATVGMAGKRLFGDLSHALDRAKGKRIDIRYFRPISAKTIAEREAGA